MTNIIKVRFLRDGQPFGREYSYLTPEEVEVDDLVEMETKTGTAKGIVTQTNVPEAEIASFKDKMKTIVGKYEEPKNAKSEAEELHEKELLGNPDTCPRCGQAKMLKPEIRNALSRRGEYYICSDCGIQEALEDAIKSGMTPKEF